MSNARGWASMERDAKQGERVVSGVVKSMVLDVRISFTMVA